MPALFVIDKKWKQPKTTGEWINNLWYIHKMEYHSTMKRTKHLIYIQTKKKNQMNLKTIMLKETREIERKYLEIIYLKRV